MVITLPGNARQLNIYPTIVCRLRISIDVQKEDIKGFYLVTERVQFGNRQNIYPTSEDE
jgi:hypothetical protein